MPDINMPATHPDDVWGVAVNTAVVEAHDRIDLLWTAHDTQQQMLDAHAITLATLATSKSPGMMDWSPGTYHTGWPAIYGGSLYVARTTTTSPPIVGAALAGPVSDTDAWAHNDVAGVTGETVTLIDGAATALLGPAVLERATHTTLIGATITADMRASDSSSSSSNRGVLIGVLDASKPLDTTGLNAAANGFWGFRLAPGSLWSVRNGSATIIGSATSGVGVFEWASLSAQFLEYDADNLMMVLSRNGTELGRAIVTRPAFAAYRIAFGSYVGVNISATHHEVQGTPSLGSQSDQWRRIGPVTDLT